MDHSSCTRHLYFLLADSILFLFGHQLIVSMKKKMCLFGVIEKEKSDPIAEKKNGKKKPSFLLHRFTRWRHKGWFGINPLDNSSPISQNYTKQKPLLKSRTVFERGENKAKIREEK